MKHLSLGGLTLVSLIIGCTSPPYLSPEETAQTWQACIDKNRFDCARELSTGEALLYVDELASYNKGTDTLDWENNVLLNLRCQITGDSAICSYHFEDELGEPLPGYLGLLRVKGYWLVNRVNFDELMPIDTFRPGDENLVFPPDSLEGELE